MNDFIISIKLELWPESELGTAGESKDMFHVFRAKL